MHPDALGTEEDKEEEDKEADPKEAESSEGVLRTHNRTYVNKHKKNTSSRKQKKRVGRTPKGKDWWTCVDLWFAKLLNDFGENTSGAEWAK